MTGPCGSIRTLLFIFTTDHNSIIEAFLHKYRYNKINESILMNRLLNRLSTMMVALYTTSVV